jgi:hypothetical protein
MNIENFGFSIDDVLYVKLHTINYEGTAHAFYHGGGLRGVVLFMKNESKIFIPSENNAQSVENFQKIITELEMRSCVNKGELRNEKTMGSNNSGGRQW